MPPIDANDRRGDTAGCHIPVRLAEAALLKNSTLLFSVNQAYIRLFTIYFMLQRVVMGDTQKSITAILYII